jgi:WD40 repeat protein
MRSFLLIVFLLCTCLGTEAQVKPGATLSKPGHQVFAVLYSDDGKLLLTGGNDNQVVMWDSESRNALNVLSGHSDWVVALAMSDDGKYIVSGSRDKSAIIWATKGGAVVKKLLGHTASISCVAFSPDGRYVATGSKDNTIKIWDFNTGNALRTLSGHSGEITSLAFSPDGQRIATASADKSIKVWDINKATIQHNLDKAHSGWVRAIRYSPDGRYLVSGGDDRLLKIWNVENAYQVLHSLKGHRDWIQSLAISEDSRFVASGDHGKVVRLWEIAAAQEKANFNSAYIVTSLAFHPNGRQLAVADIKEEVKIWDVSALGIADKEALLAKKQEETKKGQGAISNDLDFDVAVQPINYLLIVGISQYESWAKLPNAVKDAKDVKEVLLKRYAFEKEHTTEIYDSQATEENIFKAIQKLKAQVTPNDNVLIYFSGHGYYDADLKEGYWVPVDARANKTTDYFPNSTLIKYLASIDSKHTFVVADACFSGALFSASTRGYVDNVEQIKSRWGLASGSLEYVSDGVKGQNSPFASFFIKYLQSNTKKKFPVSELVQYVKVSVANNTSQTPVGSPLKNAGDEGGEFVFYLK